MKLDERIKDDYKILTCFDTVQAKQYVGTKGYFHERLEGFSDLTYCVYGTMEVNKYETATKIFHLAENGRYYKLFLPEKFIKEKQYRAYTIDEFMREFTIGNIVTFRHKVNRNSEYRAIYNGYHINSEGEFMSYLGVWKYTLEELFDYYELLNSATAKWQPFGVEE